MQKSMILIAATFAAATTPAFATTGTVVEFAFKQSELSTPAKRDLLLDRIEETSLNYCDTGSPLATNAAIKRCAADLKEQFITAIDHDELTLLAESEARAPFRTASR